MNADLGTAERPRDVPYDEFRARMQRRVDALGARQRRVFQTDAADLHAAFLAALPEELRAVHHCSTCAKFVAHHGGLVILGEDGELTGLRSVVRLDRWD